MPACDMNSPRTCSTPPPVGASARSLWTMERAAGRCRRTPGNLADRQTARLQGVAVRSLPRRHRNWLRLRTRQAAQVISPRQPATFREVPSGTPPSMTVIRPLPREQVTILGCPRAASCSDPDVMAALAASHFRRQPVRRCRPVEPVRRRGVSAFAKRPATACEQVGDVPIGIHILVKG